MLYFSTIVNPYLLTYLFTHSITYLLAYFLFFLLTYLIVSVDCWNWISSAPCSMFRSLVIPEIESVTMTWSDADLSIIVMILYKKTLYDEIYHRLSEYLCTPIIWISFILIGCETRMRINHIYRRFHQSLLKANFLFHKTTEIWSVKHFGSADH